MWMLGRSAPQPVPLQNITELLSGITRAALPRYLVPGHVGVKGNEKADEEAKKAAQGLSKPTTHIRSIVSHPLRLSKAAIDFTASIRTMAANDWKSSPYGGFTKKIDPNASPSRLQKVYDDGRKPASSPINTKSHSRRGSEEADAPYSLDQQTSKVGA
jgi:hypothetical protein